MGYIKEPEGIDFLVGPSIQTANDIRIIKAAIKKHKETGETSAVSELVLQTAHLKSKIEHPNSQIQ